MEDDQQFCLRWNNHQSTLIQNFDTLLESGTLVDCTLAAEGKYLKAHKVVLSACSPYFEGLLSEHYDKHPVFILKDVKFKELKAMMDYMYRGEVNISQDQLTALLKAAESLQIKGLSDSKTGGNSSTTTTGSKADGVTRSAKTASSTAAGVSSVVDIPHGSAGLTIEKNKVPRHSLQQVSVSDLAEDSASPTLRGISSREGSQSPTRKRKRIRRRSLGNNDDTNQSLENHEASNSSDVVSAAPALGVAPTAEDKSHADPAEPIGRSALMQQLTKQPAEDMLHQISLEKPEPSEEMIQPKSEYVDDQESVEELTHIDDDMNDLNEMEDNSRAGPSHDPSHTGMAAWHIAGDRSGSSVGAGAGAPGAQDEVFLAAHEAAQAQRDSQVVDLRSTHPIKEEVSDVKICNDAQYFKPNEKDAQTSSINIFDVKSITLKEMEQLSRGTILENPLSLRRRQFVKIHNFLNPPSSADSAPYFSTEHQGISVIRDGQSNQNELVGFFQKRKRGRPRKIREVLEIYSLGGSGSPSKAELVRNVEMYEQRLLMSRDVEQVNQFQKRKRGRPRKYPQVFYSRVGNGSHSEEEYDPNGRIYRQQHPIPRNVAKTYKKRGPGRKRKDADSSDETSSDSEEEFISDEETYEQPMPSNDQKRRRGRPRKVREDVRPLIDDDSFSDEEVYQQQRPKVENVNEFQKRKRGRPRKIREVLEIDPSGHNGSLSEKELDRDGKMYNQVPITVKVENVNEFQKRKIGRPRKIPEVVEIYSLSDNGSEEHNCDHKIENINEFQKKKRGRPRKAHEDVEICELDDNSFFSEEELDQAEEMYDEQQKLMTGDVDNVEYQKKKIGRPRKIHEEVEIYPVGVNDMVKRKRGRPKKTSVDLDSSFELVEDDEEKTDYFKEEVLVSKLRNKKI